MASKELELLKTYKEKYTFASQVNGDRLPSYKTNEMLEPIKTALKDKEDYDELCKSFGVTFPQLREALVLYKTFDIEKAKKREQALEIIRKTISTDLHFDYEEDTERWYVWIDCEDYQVYIFEGQGKEEYDLLKEVLL